jgi:hypothetical protein
MAEEAYKLMATQNERERERERGEAEFQYPLQSHILNDLTSFHPFLPPKYSITSQ